MAFTAATDVVDHELEVWLVAPLSATASARFAKDLAALRAAAAQRRAQT